LSARLADQLRISGPEFGSGPLTLSWRPEASRVFSRFWRVRTRMTRGRAPQSSSRGNSWR